ncbi:MAG: hypothetical protein KDE48_20295 [Anaerolineales bacterium]|nr:hypothetical protein [Anaerolineales bacterium]
MKKLTLVGLILLMGVVTAVAFAQSGGSFDLSWSTIDGGGGSSSGGDFVLSGSIGQPDAGELSGGDFTLSGGFWQPVCVSPGVVANETIQPDGSSVQLSWTSAAAAFNIYRVANDPYFTPGAVYANDSGSPWTDPDNNVLGNVTSNYSYVIRASSDCGESGDSRRLGEFDFGIVPGS